MLKEVTPWFLGGVALFLTLQVTNNISTTIGRILMWRASAWEAFALIGDQMPGLINRCLVLAVPFAVLLAFGRLAKDSEFKAATAGGVRPLSLLTPLLLPALLIGAAAYYNAGWLTPAGQARWYTAFYTNVYHQSVPPPTTDSYSYAEDDTFFSAGRVQTLSGTQQAQLYGILVIQGSTVYSSSSGMWDGSAHTWSLQGGSVVSAGGQPRTLNTTLVLPQHDVLRPPPTLPEQTSTPALRAQLADLKRRGAPPTEATRVVAFELSRRVADPFTPLVFVLAAGALGLLIRNRAWAAASVILFLVGFYVLWSSVPPLAQAGALAPTAAAWLPNAVFVLLGAVLAWRLR